MTKAICVSVVWSLGLENEVDFENLVVEADENRLLFCLFNEEEEESTFFVFVFECLDAVKWVGVLVLSVSGVSKSWSWSVLCLVIFVVLSRRLIADDSLWLSQA